MARMQRFVWSIWLKPFGHSEWVCTSTYSIRKKLCIGRKRIGVARVCERVFASHHLQYFECKESEKERNLPTEPPSSHYWLPHKKPPIISAFKWISHFVISFCRCLCMYITCPMSIYTIILIVIIIIKIVWASCAHIDLTLSWSFLHSYNYYHHYIYMYIYEMHLKRI